jgi:hypothetical protein
MLEGSKSSVRKRGNALCCLLAALRVAGTGAARMLEVVSFDASRVLERTEATDLFLPDLVFA